MDQPYGEGYSPGPLLSGPQRPACSPSRSWRRSGPVPMPTVTAGVAGAKVPRSNVRAAGLWGGSQMSRDMA